MQLVERVQNDDQDNVMCNAKLSPKCHLKIIDVHSTVPKVDCVSQ